MEKLVLRNPIKINDTEVKEINYDFDNLTQKDMNAAEKQMVASEQAGNMTLELVNYTWHAYLFAAAAVKANQDTDISDYMRLTGVDAIKARKLGSNFLLSAEDGDQEK